MLPVRSAVLHFCTSLNTSYEESKTVDMTYRSDVSLANMTRGSHKSIPSFWNQMSTDQYSALWHSSFIK